MPCPGGRANAKPPGRRPSAHEQAPDLVLGVDRGQHQDLVAGPQDRVATGDHEVVAYTDLIVKADPADRVQQWGTLVHRDHRGHRLGTAVKVANLRALQERFPDRTEVVTSNAEVNQYMVDINDRLGFRAVAVLPCFRRVLVGPDAR